MNCTEEPQGNAMSIKILSPPQLPEQPSKAEKRRAVRRKLLCCCGICSAVVVVLVVLLVILIFTVFKLRDPKIHVDSVTLKGLTVNVGNIFTDPNLAVDLDLATTVSVKNPNYAGFDYGNTTAYIYYQGQVIGNSPVPPGKVKARRSAQLTTATSLHVTGSNINAQLTKDVTSDVLPIVTTVQINGTAKLWGVFSIKNVRASARCDVNVYIQNQTQSFHCDYKVACLMGVNFFMIVGFFLQCKPACMQPSRIL